MDDTKYFFVNIDASIRKIIIKAKKFEENFKAYVNENEIFMIWYHSRHYFM